jgi:hypothetical protein
VGISLPRPSSAVSSRTATSTERPHGLEHAGVAFGNKDWATYTSRSAKGFVDDSSTTSAAD